MEIDEKHLENHVSAFVQAALDGEDIVITRAGEPVVKLSPSLPRSRFRIDALAEPFQTPPGVLDPKSEAGK